MNQDLTTSQASTLSGTLAASTSKNSSLTSDTYPASSTTYTRSSNSSNNNSMQTGQSSLVNAIRKFARSNMLNEDLNTLVIEYIAKTGQLPILSEKDLDQLPKLKFGHHISTMTGFVRAGGDSKTQGSSKFGKPRSSPSSARFNAESDGDSSDDECTVMAWKEDFMIRYNYDVTIHEKEFKRATEQILHWRRVWKAIQSVIEKKLLNAIDEYNRLYGYDRTEKLRCESKNCEYIPFSAYRKQLHKLLISTFDDMPPFTIQRLCELLSKTPGSRDGPMLYTNCGKFMRAVEKTLRVCSFWRPHGIFDLFDEVELPSELQSECGQSEDEDKGSVFNDTASMQSISKHSWHSKSMMSPRSCGSQSPYHNASLDNDSELQSIIRDVGPGVSAETMVRVPSPITAINKTSEVGSPSGGINKEKRGSSESLPTITKKLKTMTAANDSEMNLGVEAMADSELDKLGNAIDNDQLNEKTMKSPKEPKPRRPSTDNFVSSSTSSTLTSGLPSSTSTTAATVDTQQSQAMDTSDLTVDVEEVDVETD